MKVYDAAHIKNIAVVGHGSDGKTTLVEAILSNAGAIERRGKVEDGNTTTDYDPEEIRRQIPLCEYRKYTISEIINAVIESGFTLKRFDEHPAWTDPGLPGEFTVIAIKE